MATRLKVCCISSEEEARLAVRLGAAALGLVSEMPSGPGVIDDDLARRIAHQVPPPVSRFLLTSRTSTAALIEQVRTCGVDTVQLVDAVPLEVYEALRTSLPALRIVQVLHVEGPEIVDEARRLAPHVHALLLDSGRPNAAIRELGGTGRVHDWRHSRAIVEQVSCPVFLAGGLNALNVRQALEEVRPFGIDICSGVRTDGRLDAQKLGALVAVIDAFDRQAVP